MARVSVILRIGTAAMIVFPTIRAISLNWVIPSAASVSTIVPLQLRVVPMNALEAAADRGRTARGRWAGRPVDLGCATGIGQVGRASAISRCGEAQPRGLAEGLAKSKPCGMGTV